MLDTVILFKGWGYVVNSYLPVFGLYFSRLHLAMVAAMAAVPAALNELIRHATTLVGAYCEREGMST